MFFNAKTVLLKKFLNVLSFINKTILIIDMVINIILAKVNISNILLILILIGMFLYIMSDITIEINDINVYFP